MKVSETVRRLHEEVDVGNLQDAKISALSAFLKGELVAVDKNTALGSVYHERMRQRHEEGWTEEHDDGHTDHSLAAAAACFILTAVGYPFLAVTQIWPESWDIKWFKPKNKRRDLVRAAALIIAEIERLDRNDKQ